KVRKDQAPGDYSNPSWFRHPPGSVAYEWTGDLPAATPAPDQGSARGVSTPTGSMEVQVRKPAGGHAQH
ncbi:MAG: copper oxidase, partial [Betaproteobacteria bacterium]|nr:copper oxidase [Betaproteobacteria bacterium]